MNNLEKLKKTKFLRKLYSIQSEISEHCDGIKHVNIPNIKIIISNIFNKYKIEKYIDLFFQFLEVKFITEAKDFCVFFDS